MLNSRVAAMASLLLLAGCSGGGKSSGPIKNLTVAYTSATTLHLAWVNAATGATSVNVERGTVAAGPFDVVSTLAANAAAYDDAGVVLSTRYYYRVTPVPGSPSGVVSAEPPPIPVAPAAPAITTSVLSDTSIRVDWTHSGTDVKGFRVERLMNYIGYSYVDVADLPATARTFTDTCLRPGSPHLYKVTAINEGGVETSATTLNNINTAAPTAVPASGPTNLRATPLTANSYRVEWTNTCSTADRIFIEDAFVLPSSTAYAGALGPCNTSGGAGCLMSDATYVTAIDFGVGSRVKFRVSSGNALGFSAVSNELTLDGPAAPPPAGGGSVGVFADYDNKRVYSDLLESANATAYPTGGLTVGCFWSFNTFLGIQDFICYSSALHFPLSGTGVNGAAFDLTGKTIDRAYMVLSAYDIPINPSNYQAAAISQSWSTGTLNGNTSLSLYSAGASAQGSPTAYGPYTFDVTTIAQNWANGSFQNNGILVEDAEYVFPYDSLIRTGFFFSTDAFNNNAYNRPTLWVDYH